MVNPLGHQIRLDQIKCEHASGLDLVCNSHHVNVCMYVCMNVCVYVLFSKY